MNMLHYADADEASQDHENNSGLFLTFHLHVNKFILKSI